MATWEPGARNHSKTSRKDSIVGRYFSSELCEGIRLKTVDVLGQGILLSFECCERVVHGVVDLTEEYALCNECTYKASTNQDLWPRH